MTTPTPRATPQKASQRTAPVEEVAGVEVSAAVAPAVERAAQAIEGVLGFGASWIDEARAALAAALDIPQMASAIVDHMDTDTLSGDADTLVCAGCGHVLVTGDPDDDRDPQAEHATHHAALIAAHMLGGAA